MKHCDHLHWKLLLSAVKGFVVLRSKARQRSDSEVFYIEERCLVIERYKLCPFLL